MRQITRPRVCALVFFCMLLWVPIASGQQVSATGTPQPVAGTTVVVRMIDAVDSGSDPAGKQYRASVAGPVNAGNNITIAQGSVATITLVRNASGWAARLTSLFINGRVTPADSSLAALAGTAPHSLDNDVAVLTGHASGTSTVPGLAAIASGARIILPAGTSLSFVLNAPAANGPAPANPAEANASALPANQPGKSYYCTFNDTVQRPNTTHYFSGVFQDDASQIEVSKAWTNYIRQKYLPGDNRDNGGCQIGTADQQQRVETTLRKTWQVMATGSEKAGMKIPTNTVVDVSWKYVPDHPSASSAAGTPPSTAAASVAPPASASTATTAKPPAAAAGQSAPAQAQNQQDLPYICSVTSSERQPSRTTFYRTGVFQTAASLGTISDAWQRYVIKTYSTPVQEFMPPHCDRVQSDPAGQQYTQTSMDQSAQAQKSVIVHVDWKYTPDQATAPVAQAAPAATAAQPPATQYLFCTGVASPQSTIYYSGTIITTEKNTNPVHVAFFQFLKQQYSYKGPGEYPCDLQCTGVRSVEEARSVEQLYVNRDRQNKRNVIETGWTYRQDKPTVASGKGKPYYCFGYNVNKALYFSDTFEVPPNTPANPVINGFAQFLTEKYGVSSRTGWDGGIRCSWGDKAKFVPEPGMTGYKIVETEWKPTSLPPPYVGP